MIDKRTIWRQALGAMAEDFFDLFLSPVQPFPDNVSYPVTPGMEALINDRFDSLYLPDKRLVHVAEVAEENWTEQDERKTVDRIVLLEWEVLNGFGHESALNLGGASFEGLRRLARISGTHLAQVLGRMLRMWELYEILGDVLATMFRQLPAKELGEAMRELFTPGYLKAHASVKYVGALFFQDSRILREAEEVLQASEADLSREIDIAMSGISSVELGKWLKCVAVEGMSFFRELFASEEFRQKMPELPLGFQWLAWYVGYCFRLHLQSDPTRAKRVLEVIGSHQEVSAVMEEYRWLHSWGGDRNKAVDLAWQSVAPKCFGISKHIEKITEDEDQERLIGVASGLETYCSKNPAIVGLMDGVSGGVEVYLAKAGNHREKDWSRKQRTKGNRALTEAAHPQTENVVDRKYSAAEQEVEELSEDEILSRLKERYHPSGDSVVEEVEAKENSIAWYTSLTERERTAINLAAEFDTEEEIAEEMGISQQRVSQLLEQALRKYRKLC